MSTVEPHFRTTEKSVKKMKLKHMNQQVPADYWLKQLKHVSIKNDFLESCVLKASAVECQFVSLIEQWSTSQSASWLTPGLSLSFNSPVTLIFTPVANLLLYGWTVSTTGQFTHNIKGPSYVLSRNRCNGLQVLMTALDTRSTFGW